MAHIVLIVTGIPGKLNNTFEVARLLESAGHQITYVSADDLAAEVKAQGFSYASVVPDKQVYSTAARTYRERRRRAIESLGIDKFRRVIRNLAPDLLLFDIELHAYIIASFPLPTPKALLCPFFSIWKHKRVPPLHYYLVPGEGWRGHWLNIERAWWQYRLKRWLQIEKQRLRSLGVDNLAIHRHLARESGFPFRDEALLYHWLKPFTYRTLPVLNMTARELELPHQPRSDVYYVGTLVRTDRKETRVDPEVEDVLEQIFSRRASSHSKRTLVYCAFATYRRAHENSDRQIIRRLIGVAKDHPEWDLVLGLGGVVSPDELGEMPSNLYAFRWAPQLKVLREADCALIQGGLNGVNECVHFGVPMVVYPGRVNDQKGNAARVVYHGLGVAVAERQMNTELLGGCIEEVVRNPLYRSKVMQMRERIQHYERDNRVAQVVDSLLSSQSETNGQAPQNL